MHVQHEKAHERGLRWRVVRGESDGGAGRERRSEVQVRLKTSRAEVEAVIQWVCTACRKERLVKEEIRRSDRAAEGE